MVDVSGQQEKNNKEKETMTEEKKEETKQEEVKEEKSVFEPSSLVGLVLSAAEELAKKAGWKTRVMSQDGTTFMGTTDYVENRASLTINNNKVEKVEVG